MNIEISENAIQAQINEAAAKAIGNAMSGYEVQKAIGSAITGEIVQGAVGEAIRLAVASVDTNELTTAIAKELQAAMLHAITGMIREGMTTMICGMRNIPHYDKDERIKVRKELFGE